MCCNRLVFRKLGVVAATFLVSLATVPSVVAQFTLDSFSPAFGATNIPTVTTVSFTFSAPVDTQAEYDISGGFYLGVAMYPDPGEPLQIDLAPGNQTVSVQLALQANQQYWVVLRTARSATGTDLDRPYAYTFTTGSNLPSASISGALSFPDGTVEGTVVELFPPFFDMGNSDSGGDADTGPFGFVVVTGSSGEFVMEHIPAGSYFLIAEKDVDGDGEPTADVPGEGIGAFDASADRVPDVVDVQPGEQLSGMDFTVQLFRSNLARENFSGISDLAIAEHADASATSVQGASVSAGGKSEAWMYVFYAPASEDTLAFVSVGHLFGPTPSLSESGMPGQPMIPLPDNWIDSSTAMMAAEAAGGSEFRTAHPNPEVMAILFQADEDQPFPMKKDLSDAFGSASSLPELESLTLSLGSLLGELPIWLVAYFPTDSFSFLFVAIDAVTGDVYKVFGAATPAHHNRDACTQAALAWQPDAVLVSVNNQADGVSIDEAGRSMLWSFVYYSAGSNTALRVMASSGSVFSTEEIGIFDTPSLYPLPPIWINSDAAMAAAEAASNGYRARYPNAMVMGLLSRELRPNHPGMAIWLITYFDPILDPVGETYMVNAVTGIVITGTETHVEIPQTGILYQNYPNPFVHETTITFDVANSESVELAVFNVLGQRIRSLLSDSRGAPGIHTVTFDGIDESGRLLSAGLYFYRLRIGRSELTRAMILSR